QSVARARTRLCRLLRRYRKCRAQRRRRCIGRSHPRATLEGPTGRRSEGQRIWQIVKRKFQFQSELEEGFFDCVTARSKTEREKTGRHSAQNDTCSSCVISA